MKIERKKIVKKLTLITAIITIFSASFYFSTASIIRLGFMIFWSLRFLCIGILLITIYIHLRVIEKTGFSELGFKKVKSLKYGLIGVVLWLLIYSIARLVLRTVYPPAGTVLEIERYPPLG